jgi:probable HAF family extracellular repeat protein
MLIVAATLLAVAAGVAAQEQESQQGNPEKKELHHYKLIVLGTLGGPNSYGDGGHGAGNINNRGIAVGVADTAIPDPNYPSFASDPFISHAFRTERGTIVDLGALPGVNSSSVSWISANGLVSGQSLNGSTDPLIGGPEANAVLWKDGQIINLGTLGGFESAAGRVNSHGQITGFSGNAVPDPFSIIGLGTQTRAFIWQNGVMEDLGTLGGPDAFAPLINERGQIAGISYPDTTPSSNCPWPLTTHLFLWASGKMRDLGTLGGTCILPDDMNDQGQIVGFSNMLGDTEAHAFLWSQGELTDIGTLGGTYGEATSLNEGGEAAGLATIAGDLELHSFIWKRGVLTDLGSLANYDSSCIGAFGINSKDQIVGQATENFCAGPGAHAILWQDGNMIDLNVFVPSGSGVTLTDVENINDRGEMFGSAVLANGDVSAFLLIPCEKEHPDIEHCVSDDAPSQTVDENRATPTASHTATTQPNLTPIEMKDRIRALLANRNRKFRFLGQI